MAEVQYSSAELYCDNTYDGYVACAYNDQEYTGIISYMAG